MKIRKDNQVHDLQVVPAHRGEVQGYAIAMPDGGNAYFDRLNAVRSAEQLPKVLAVLKSQGWVEVEHA